MTTADPLVYYPQYCFHLSPTINKWCPLRAIDIAGLERRPNFEDVDVFFYLNHPIRWVRVIGVVVAIDDYYGRRVYTIDDSSGQCVECAQSTPNTAGDKISHDNGSSSKTTESRTATTTNASTARVHVTKILDATPLVPSSIDIDVGTVLDVKGMVKLFRDQKQLKIEKVTPVLSTNQEVLFWDKIRHFRHEVLSRLWVLTDREVRKCRKLQQIEDTGHKAMRRKRKAGGQDEGPCANRSGAERTQGPEGDSKPKRSISGSLTRTTRTRHDAETGSSKPSASGGNKYDALGL